MFPEKDDLLSAINSMMMWRRVGDDVILLTSPSADPETVCSSDDGRHPGEGVELKESLLSDEGRSQRPKLSQQIWSGNSKQLKMMQ